MGSRVKVKRHLVIPDVQHFPDAPVWHLKAAARYAAEKQPDVIVSLGDWDDFPSLSSYDKGKRSAEGKRVIADIKAGNESRRIFFSELKKRSPRGYKPEFVIVLGNHENRVNVATNDDPRLYGLFSLDDLNWKEFGVKVYPFLKPVEIDRILYAHFWPVAANGRVTQQKYGCPSAHAQVQRVGKTCTAGHSQGLSQACVPSPTGLRRGLIAGSFYPTEFDYQGPMGAEHWRGILMCNDIRENGYYDLCEVSIGYLRRNYA